MKPTTYTLIMKSGRTFLVEEFVSQPMHQSTQDFTYKTNKGVLVKELSVAANKGVCTSTGNEFKNICFITKNSAAIKYINTIDALGLERMKGDDIKYIDI